MLKTLYLSTLALSLSWGFSADADGQTADQPVPVASPPGSKQAEAPPTRRRLLDRFRPSQKPAPSSIEVPASPPAARRTAATQPNPTDRQVSDPRLRQAQTATGDLNLPALPGASYPIAGSGASSNPSPLESGQSLSLNAALYGAITSNPDVVALRQNNVASAEAVEVARRFPTTLNPTLWVDVRPLTLERIPAGPAADGTYHGTHYQEKNVLMYFSLRQPIEWGHQTTHRYNIAKAAYSQQQWNVVQAELTALVQTYRFFQTAAYRREKLQVAKNLATFNAKLLETLKRRLEAGQVPASAVSLASVETRATEQLVEAAEQDYVTALTDLRNQIGRPEAAGTAEPLGEFVLPAFIPEIQDEALIQTALMSRPEIHAARAAINGAKSSVCLAKADRIPTSIVGPTYEADEQGTQFFGFVYITPLPVLNNGTPLVHQREADLRRSTIALQNAEQRVVSQVRAATAKWNGATKLVRKTSGLTDELAKEVGVLERQFEAGQADLTTLFQARQRLIQLENAKLDATWAATQAQADLLLALGAPNLIASLRSGEGVPDPAAPPADPAMRPPFQPVSGIPDPPR